MECRQPAAAVTPWSAIYRAGLVAASGCSACARPMNAAMASRVLLPRGVVLIEPREVRATTVRSSCHDSFFFFSFVLRPSGLSHHGVMERLACI